MARQPMSTITFPIDAAAEARPRSRLWPVVLPLVVCLPLFVYRLGDRDLASSHEARAGQDAQTILATGDWLLPRLYDGRVEMQKPPLYYWLVALCGLANGGTVDAWCVRLPAALAATGCVLLLLAWGRSRGRPLAGLLAALMLATALHFTTLARVGRIDMVLTFTVALTLVAFAQGRRLLGSVAVAVGVMLKGPIAVALPVAVGCCWWLASRGRKPPEGNPQRLEHPSGSLRSRLAGVGIVLVLTIPWFAYATIQTDGEWFRVFFWYHNVDRGLGTEENLRAYPPWFYGPQLLLDFLPWSLLLPLAAWHVWRRREDADARFGAVWLVAMLLLLSCMRFKRSDYLLPAFPGAAWMLGCCAETWYRERPRRGLVVAFGATVACVLGLWLAYLHLIEPAIEATRTHRRFAEEVRRHTGGQVLFFRAEAHNIAFRVGRPLAPLLEWENLDVWAGMPQTTYVVLPPEEFAAWRDHLHAGELELVLRSEDLGPEAPPWLAWVPDNRERPYVLARTRSLNHRDTETQRRQEDGPMGQRSP
jgi:4-amino-4-deoxy-L-arabinose transferase-like glycosyltransferase